MQQINSYYFLTAGISGKALALKTDNYYNVNITTVTY